MPDLGVAHLPVGQADARAPSRSAACAGAWPTARRTPASPPARPRCPARPAPAPSRRARRGRRAGTLIARRPAVDDLPRTSSASRRGAADQRAVDVGQREQLGGVVGLQRAAVEDPHAPCPAALSKPWTSARTKRDRVLRLLGRGRQAGADRPDRLVGDDDLGQPLDRHLLERLLDLVAELALGVAALALLLGLADAEDRDQAGLERPRHLLLEGAVGLAEVLRAARSARAPRRATSISASIGAETSPVNAPESFSCMFCA